MGWRQAVITRGVAFAVSPFLVLFTISAMLGNVPSTELAEGIGCTGALGCRRLGPYVKGDSSRHPCLGCCTEEECKGCVCRLMAVPLGGSKAQGAFTGW